MSTTIDVLKRKQDNISTCTTADALKRELDMAQSRIAALEQRLHEMSYAEFRGICYKAFSTRKTFSDATAACGENGGTLAMPRDAETNAFLISLHNAVSDNGSFWTSIDDRRNHHHHVQRLSDHPPSN
ncbi:C-type lectin domain family 3 member A homolog [Branchiostoma floridae x Branchiostoma japonicum]